MRARRGLLAGLALIVLTNAAILAGAAWNRSGEPEATVVLTERELRLPYAHPNADEDTGIVLSLTWAPRWLGAVPALEGLPEQVLRDLGFDLSTPASHPEAVSIYARQAPRLAWVVLEIEGESWRRWVAERRKEPRDCASGTAPGVDPLQRDRVEHTRLMVADAGLDAGALRRRYPDRRRHLILRGTVRPQVVVRDGKPPVLAGQVSEILASEVYVPLHLRPVLDRALQADRAPRSPRDWEEPRAPRHPRYRATVSFGRRHEPWLVDVRALPAPAAAPVPPAVPGGPDSPGECPG